MTYRERVSRSPYRVLFDLVLFRLDPERAHHLTVDALRAAQAVPGGRAVLRRVFGHGTGDAAPRTVLGVRHGNPFGLAAGFDKDAEVALALLDLGFGHVEVGTITPRPQSGNDRPRSFRLVPDEALINRMGFNNEGAEAAARRLRRVRATRRGRDAVIGVNIGKNKTTPPERAADDYRIGARVLGPSASYLAINVSSPNTPGLRDLQSVDALRPILRAVTEEAAVVGRRRGRDLPVLVKIAPDLHDEDLVSIAELVQEVPLAGVIATNTTIARPSSLRTDRTRIEAIGAGGLSGPVLADRSRAVLKLLRDALGPDPVLISCGGVTTAEDVQERLEAGADLVQGYTALIYQGPSWPGRIARRLRPAP